MQSGEVWRLKTAPGLHPGYKKMLLTWLGVDSIAAGWAQTAYLLTKRLPSAAQPSGRVSR
jgi:hypothetical protein